MSTSAINCENYGGNSLLAKNILTGRHSGTGIWEPAGFDSVGGGFHVHLQCIHLFVSPRTIMSWDWRGNNTFNGIRSVFN